MNELIRKIGNRCIDSGNYRSQPAVFLPVKERIAEAQKLVDAVNHFAEASRLVPSPVAVFAGPDVKAIDVFLARRALAETIVSAIAASFALGTAAYLETDINDLLNK